MLGNSSDHDRATEIDKRDIYHEYHLYSIRKHLMT